MRNSGILVDAILKWFDKNARDLPWRRTSDPYGIWISEIMLQQTQVKTVIPYWNRWMQKFPNIEALAKAKPDEVLKHWEGLGYYSRSRNISHAAKIILSKHKGIFPHDFDEIIALPGIGPYTAGAICSIAFNQPAPILDGNIIRVLTRVFGIRTNPREARTNKRLWKLATDLVKQAGQVRHRHRHACSKFNQGLMELGATVCTPRNPQCAACPLRLHCTAFKKDLMAVLPNLRPHRDVQRCRVLAFVVVHENRFLVRRRPAVGINAGLWEFPNLETPSRDDGTTTAAKFCLGFEPHQIQPLCNINHTITRSRIRLEVFTCRIEQRPPRLPRSIEWRSLSQLEELAFPSAHRKIVEMLGQNFTEIPGA